MIDMYRTLGVSIPCDQYKDYFKSLTYLYYHKNISGL